MTDTERIIDKIKKLIRHEQSARSCSTKEEAAAFAAKIHELLAQHKINLSEVAVDDESAKAKVGEEEVQTGRKLRYGGGYVPLEDNCLMNVIAKAHFCQAVLLAGTNVILVVGEEQDRAVVVEMFRFLLSTMKRLARIEEEVTRKKRLSVRKFKPYFYRGFTYAVWQRYDALQQKESECTALVRANALVKAYVAEKHKTEEVKTRKRKGRHNRHGYFAGLHHGRQVDLGTNVMGGGGESAVGRLQ